MPNQAATTASRDFAFHSTDHYPQALRGGLEQSTSTAYLHNSADRYHADGATNASNAPSAIQTPSQEAGLSYPAYPASGLDEQSGAQFPPNFAYNTGGSLVWDWNNSIEFPEFTSQYEPQGELVQEPQERHFQTQDFSIPLPVTNQDTSLHSPQLVQSAPITVTQNPLSPPPKPQPPRPALQTGMKRKAESEPNSAVSQGTTVPPEIQPPPAKRPNKSRSSSLASPASPSVPAPPKDGPTSMAQTGATPGSSDTPAQTNSATNNETQRRKEPSKGTGPAGRVIDVSKPRRIAETSGGDFLPAGKVFPIQIGSELFRLSGASISSDAPSYFSHFFGEQLRNNSSRAGDMRTLYIDRDPATFRDISLHLQGYHIKPRDSKHFVKLFADAQFYSLPRLIKSLFNTDIFIRIGQRDFQIPRDLFSAPGDSPNYFSLGFAHFFSTPTEVFPGLDRTSLLRPPSIAPPAVPGRSGDTFAEIIKLLQGYDVQIRDEGHRAELLRDARYFHLKGLEQRLIPCDISFNLKRSHSEIVIRLEDIRQSGISFTPDNPSSNSSSSGSVTGLSPNPAGGNANATSKPASPAPSIYAYSAFRPGNVSYARPYTDDHAKNHTLILETSIQESTTLHFPSYAPPPASSSFAPSLDLRATFHATTLARITSLFSVVASKMGLPATQPLGLMMMASGGGVAAQPVSPANSGVSESRVRVRWEDDAFVVVDGEVMELDIHAETGKIGVRLEDDGKRSKRRRIEDRDANEDHDDSDRNNWVWGGPKPESVPSLSVMDDSGSWHRAATADDDEVQWIVKRAQWRIRVENVDALENSAGGSGSVSSSGGSRMQVVLCIVRLEAIKSEKVRNRQRGFLKS